MVPTGVPWVLLKGAAAVGGPPVILFYFSSPAGVAVSRASIIAYFMGIDMMGLIMTSIQGLTTTRTLLLALICLVPLFIGITLGSRLFVKLDQKSFRNYVLILLMILAAVGMVRSVFF